MTETHNVIPQQESSLDSLAGFQSDIFQQSFNSFFGFSENPFSNTPDPSFFFMSRFHQEALLSMNFGVYQRRGFIVVTGEVGAGKTTLCRRFLAQLSPEIKTAVILNSRVSGTHLLSSVIQDFGISSKWKGKRGLYESLAAFLLEGIQQHQNACLIIDEAQCLNLKVLEEIRLLSNLETSKQKLIQIVLLGQPEFREILKRPSLRQLRQRVGVSIHLKGLDLVEARDYIFHRLGHVSCGPCQIAFDAEVLERIHQMTRGIPRLINTACDRILMSAYTKQTKEINMEVAREAFDEVSFMCMEI